MEYFKINENEKLPVIAMGTGALNLSYKKPLYFCKRVLKEFFVKIKGQYSKEKNYTVHYELRKLLNFKKSIKISLKVGYELYDTSNAYGNCKMMGKVLKKHNRDEFFIISKCSNTAQRNGTVREEFERGLKELGLDYIDLYLIHWPQPGCYIETWKILEQLFKEGKVKTIGVSNFNIHHIEDLKKNCEIMPMVNEVECHPLLQQNELRNYCKENNIVLAAHTPTGKMRSNITNTVLKDIALEHNKTIAQVILRWHYQLGDISVCNTLNKEHMEENLDIFDFELTSGELIQIKELDCNFRIWPDPETADFNKL